VTPFETWLVQADALLAAWDPSRADELDDLVERGLDLTENGAHIDAPAGSPDQARLQMAIARVTTGLTERRDEVGGQLGALSRQRLDLTRSASGIAGYIAADALSPVS
jgi:hypothetical protein